MKITTLVALFGAAEVCSSTWIPATPTDRRSPCPMLNSLANHGYLPRDGLNISMQNLIDALKEAVNLDPAATHLVANEALSTSTTGYIDTFNLDDLAQPGVIEHDGSLSRSDFYLGDNISFNDDIWKSVVAIFRRAASITLINATVARANRLAAAADRNSRFSLSPSGEWFSAIETALYMTVFAEPTHPAQARIIWVIVMFTEERLPFKEGWVRPKAPLTAKQMNKLARKIMKTRANIN